MSKKQATLGGRGEEMGRGKKHPNQNLLQVLSTSSWAKRSAQQPVLEDRFYTSFWPCVLFCFLTFLLDRKQMEDAQWVQGSTAPWATWSWGAVLLGTDQPSRGATEQKILTAVDRLLIDYGIHMAALCASFCSLKMMVGSRSTQPVSAGTRQGYRLLRGLSF